jgi:hypothetical protein
MVRSLIVQKNIFLGRRSFAVLLIFSFLMAGLVIAFQPSRKRRKRTKKARCSASLLKATLSPKQFVINQKNSSKFKLTKTPTVKKRRHTEKLSKITVHSSSLRKIAEKTRLLPNLEVQTLDTTISLPNAKFEPLLDAPAETLTAESAKSESSGFKKDYYIVQFGGYAKDEWLDSLRDAGAEVVQYIPNQAFMIYGDAAAMSKIAGHSRVRWVGKYAPERKVSLGCQ